MTQQHKQNYHMHVYLDVSPKLFQVSMLQIATLSPQTGA